MPTFLKQDFTSGEKKFLPNEIFIFAAALLVIFLLFYTSILYQQSVINDKTSQIQKEIQEIDAGRDKAKERELLAFADQLNNLSNLLSARVYLSKFLKVIDDTVQPRVVYTDLGVDLERQGFELKGQAASYGVLARQMVKLGESSTISNLGLANTIVQLGGVSFTLRGVLNSNQLK